MKVSCFQQVQRKWKRDTSIWTSSSCTNVFCLPAARTLPGSTFMTRCAPIVCRHKPSLTPHFTCEFRAALSRFVCRFVCRMAAHSKSIFSRLIFKWRTTTICRTFSCIQPTFSSSSDLYRSGTGIAIFCPVRSVDFFQTRCAAFVLSCGSAS